VSDTGEGIPADELRHVFTRFHRVKGAHARTEEGSGIGLALAHQLVHLHAGQMRVKSQLGKGTTFTVWVPFRRTAPPVTDAPEPNGEADRTRPTARALADAALGWAEREGDGAPLDDERDGLAIAGRAVGSRVLVVDDNRDMRDYHSP